MLGPQFTEKHPGHELPSRTSEIYICYIYKLFFQPIFLWVYVYPYFFGFMFWTISLLGDFNVHIRAELDSEWTNPEGRVMVAFAISFGYSQLVNRTTHSSRAANSNRKKRDLPSSRTIWYQKTADWKGKGLIWCLSLERNMLYRQKCQWGWPKHHRRIAVRYGSPHCLQLYTIEVQFLTVVHLRMQLRSQRQI